MPCDPVKTQTPRRIRASSVAIAALTGLCLTALPASAEVFADYDPAVNDRFLDDLVSGTTTPTPNPSFILSGYDLTGIAVDDTGAEELTPPRGATMITPQHYLTTDHFFTNNPEFVGSDGVLRQYATSGSRVLTTTFIDDDGNTVILTSDIRIGRLAAPIPPEHGITPLPIAIATDSAGFIGQSVYAFAQDNVAGTNIIDLMGLDFQTDPNTGNELRPTFVVAFDFDTPTNGGVLGTGDSEIGLAPGDSSHPLVIDVDGELALIGAHFGIIGDEDETGNFDFTSNYLSESSRLDLYLDQINAYVGQDGYSVRTVIVPEPAGLALLSTLPTLLLRRRR